MLERSLESLTAHPIDNLVQSFNSEARQAGRKLDVIRNFELEPHQRQEVSRLIAEMDQQVKLHYSQQHKFENWRERQDFLSQANQFFINASRECEKLLTVEQQTEVFRNSLKKVGWDALFDEHVRVSIELSDFQFCMIKDVYLDSILLEQELNAQWRKSSPEEKIGIRQKIIDARVNRDSRFSTILTEPQIEKFDAYCGTSFGKKKSAQLTNK